MLLFNAKHASLILALLFSASAWAEEFPPKAKFPRQMTLNPKDVTLTVLDRKVRVFLNDRSVVKGKVVAGDGAQIVLQGKEIKASTVIPLHQIERISFRTDRPTGVYAGLLAAGVAVMGLISQDSEHGEYGWLAVAASFGAAVALYLTRPSTTIYIAGADSSDAKGAEVELDATSKLGSVDADQALVFPLITVVSAK